jgi:hypothetical protein
MPRARTTQDDDHAFVRSVGVLHPAYQLIVLLYVFLSLLQTY